MSDQQDRPEDELRRLSEAATPGPWHVEEWGPDVALDAVYAGDQRITCDFEQTALFEPSDAAFIVAAVNHVRSSLSASPLEPRTGLSAEELDESRETLTVEQVVAWFGEPRYSVADLQHAYAQGYVAAAPSPESGEPDDDALDVFAWLIERGQSENHVPTVWWADRVRWGSSVYADDWTTDAFKAMRFVTREAAEEVIAEKFTPPPSRGGPTARAVEHGFLAAARATTGAEPAAIDAAALDAIDTPEDDADLAALLHDNGFSWDDANAVNAILTHYGLVVRRLAALPQPGEPTPQRAWDPNTEGTPW